MTIHQCGNIDKTIGVLNLMPNKIQTETQILSLLESTKEDLKIKFIRLNTYQPKNINDNYLIENYHLFNDIKEELDGIIVTGAPVEQLSFEEVKYIDELREIIDYSINNLKSSIFICWSAQAALNHVYGIRKTNTPQKIFGVYSHQILDNDDILNGLEIGFESPHSRHTTLLKEDVSRCNDIKVLCTTDCEKEHIIKGKFNDYYIFGHCEYDKESLKREYLRDVSLNRPIDIPINYFRNNDPDDEIIVKWDKASIRIYKNWIKAL